METYSFPILSVNELFTFLNQTLNIPLSSEAELTKPQCDSLKDIYAALVEICRGKPCAEFLAAQTDESLKHPELLESVLPTMRLFVVTRQVLLDIGCHEDSFSLLDLIEPEPRRTRRFMSAFVNFIRFLNEEQDLVYREGAVVTHISRQTYLKVKDEYEHQLREFQSAKKLLADQQPLLEEKQRTIEELKAREAELKQLKDQDEAEIQELAEAVEASKAKVAELAEANARCEAEIQEISARLRQSPEKVMSRYYTLKQEVADEMAAINELQQLVRAAVAKNEAMDNLSNTLTAALQRQANLEALQTQVKERTRVIHQIRQKTLELEQVHSAQKAEVDSLTTKAKKQQSKVDRRYQTYECQRAQLELVIQKAKNERDAIKQEFRALQKQFRECEEELSTLEEAKAMTERNCHAQLDLQVAEFAEICRQAEVYSERMRNLLRQYAEVPQCL